MTRTRHFYFPSSEKGALQSASINQEKNNQLTSAKGHDVEISGVRISLTAKD